MSHNIAMLLELVVVDRQVGGSLHLCVIGRLLEGIALCRIALLFDRGEPVAKQFARRLTTIL